MLNRSNLSYVWTRSKETNIFQKRQYVYKAQSDHACSILHELTVVVNDDIPQLLSMLRELTCETKTVRQLVYFWEHITFHAKAPMIFAGPFLQEVGEDFSELMSQLWVHGDGDWTREDIQREYENRTVEHIKPGQLRAGDYCEAADREGVWYVARVRTTTSRSVLVRFLEWSYVHDEWIRRNSNRLASIGTGKLCTFWSRGFRLLPGVIRPSLVKVQNA
jgi:hypothetical protein